MRDWMKERYTANGRPSIDPVVFFPSQLIMFFAGQTTRTEASQPAFLGGVVRRPGPIQ